jgi:hypothetical protein
MKKDWSGSYTINYRQPAAPRDPASEVLMKSTGKKCHRDAIMHTSQIHVADRFAIQSDISPLVDGSIN